MDLTILGVFSNLNDSMKAWQEPAGVILHLGAPPAVTSPVLAAPQQPLPGRTGGQQAERGAPACSLACLSCSLAMGSREPRSTSTRHQTVLETLQHSAKEGGPTAEGVTLSPVPKFSAQQASTCIPACGSRRVTLPPAASHSAGHTSLSATQAWPCCVPACEDPPALGTTGTGGDPRHHLHAEPPSAAALLAPRSSAVRSAQQPCFHPTEHLRLCPTQQLRTWLLHSFAGNKHATTQQQHRDGRAVSQTRAVPCRGPRPQQAPASLR